MFLPKKILERAHDYQVGRHTTSRLRNIRYCYKLNIKKITNLELHVFLQIFEKKKQNCLNPFKKAPPISIKKSIFLNGILDINCFPKKFHDFGDFDVLEIIFLKNQIYFVFLFKSIIFCQEFLANEPPEIFTIIFIQF